MAIINGASFSAVPDHQLDATVNEIFPGNTNNFFLDHVFKLIINQVYPGLSKERFDGGKFSAKIQQIRNIGSVSGVCDHQIYVSAIDYKRPPLPPRGEIVITSVMGEKKLNNSNIHRGDTTELCCYVWGDWIGTNNETTGAYEGLNPTFTCKLSPEDSDDDAVFKKTVKNGDIVFIGPDKRTSYAGTTFSLVYRIYLRPNDFDKELFKTPRYLYYDFQLDDGMGGGRTYTIEGKRGEKMLITSDIYRGD